MHVERCMCVRVCRRRVVFALQVQVKYNTNTNTALCLPLLGVLPLAAPATPRRRFAFFVQTVRCMHSRRNPTTEALCHPRGGWLLQCWGLYYALHCMLMACPNQDGTQQGQHGGSCDAPTSVMVGLWIQLWRLWIQLVGVPRGPADAAHLVPVRAPQRGRGALLWWCREPRRRDSGAGGG